MLFSFFHSITSAPLIIIFLIFFLFPHCKTGLSVSKLFYSNSHKNIELQILMSKEFIKVKLKVLFIWQVISSKTKEAENLDKSRLSALFSGVPDRNRTCDVSLRRAPTYCHSLSIWGKVNPYGTLYKTVSDSIRVILNTPFVKLCKALKVSCLFAPANNRGMPWYYHRHLLYDHHALYVRSW